MKWRWREILREGVAGIRLRSTIALLLFTAALTASGLFAASVAQSVIADELALRQDGSLVWSATPGGGSGTNKTLSASVCSGLANNLGVVASGGVLASQGTEFSELGPGKVREPLVRVTANALSVWGVDSAGSQVFLGQQLAAHHTGDVGNVVRPINSTISGTRIEALLPASLPVATLDSSIVIVTGSNSPLSVCWVRMSPNDIAQGQALLLSAYGTSATVSRFLPPDAVLASPAATWSSFTSAQWPLVIGLVLALVVAAISWFERARYGVYRLYGSSRLEVAAIVTVEYSILAAIGWMVSLAIGAVLSALIEMPLLVFAIASGASLTCAIALLPLSGMAAVSGSLLRILRVD